MEHGLHGVTGHCVVGLAGEVHIAEQDDVTIHTLHVVGTSVTATIRKSRLVTAMYHVR